MKLGDKVRYKKCLVAINWMARHIDEEATKEFAKANGIRYDEGDIYYGGWTVFSKWKVKVYSEVQEGIVCGIRNIDLTGTYDDEGWHFGKKKKVYLVARNMTGFDRVPEEFIISKDAI